MWLEVDIPQMKHRGEQSVDTIQLLWGEAQDVHGTQQTSEVLPVIFTFYSTVSSLQTCPFMNTHTD